MGTTVNIQLSAQIVVADSSNRVYEMSKRNCLFEYETETRAEATATGFNVYSQQNCVYDCAMGLVLDKSGFECVPFDVPYLFKEGETKVCNGTAAALFKKEFRKMAQDSDECIHCRRPACNQVSYQSLVCNRQLTFSVCRGSSSNISLSRLIL